MGSTVSEKLKVMVPAPRSNSKSSRMGGVVSGTTFWAIFANDALIGTPESPVVSSNVLGSVRK